MDAGAGVRSDTASGTNIRGSIRGISGSQSGSIFGTTSGSNLGTLIGSSGVHASGSNFTGLTRAALAFALPFDLPRFAFGAVSGATFGSPGPGAMPAASCAAWSGCSWGASTG